MIDPHSFDLKRSSHEARMLFRLLLPLTQPTGYASNSIHCNITLNERFVLPSKPGSTWRRVLWGHAHFPTILDNFHDIAYFLPDSTAGAGDEIPVIGKGAYDLSKLDDSVFPSSGTSKMARSPVPKAEPSQPDSQAAPPAEMPQEDDSKPESNANASDSNDSGSSSEPAESATKDDADAAKDDADAAKDDADAAKDDADATKDDAGATKDDASATKDDADAAKDDADAAKDEVSSRPAPVADADQRPVGGAGSYSTGGDFGEMPVGAAAAISSGAAGSGETGGISGAQSSLAS